MPGSSRSGPIGIRVRAEVAPAAGETRPDTPFRILVLGDFRGTVRDIPRARRTPVLVDRDNFDDALAHVGPELTLPPADADGPPVRVAFGSLEDFHPDRLYERLDLFQALRRLRDRLKDPLTFAAAAAELRSPAVPPAPEPAPAADPAGLLEQILGGAPTPPREPGPGFPGGGEWDAFIRRIVKPHLAPRVDMAEQDRLVGVVDETIGRQMRALLHRPDFQALEAAWRALFFLVRRLEAGIDLKLYLLDVSRDELAEDLAAPAAGVLHRILVEQAVGTPGGQPWALVVGLYTFDDRRQDAELLGRIARTAERAGVLFLAAAHPHLVGCESLVASPDPDDWDRLSPPDDARAWEALRTSPEAAFVGLLLPRFLLRLPYGRETEPIEHFSFEEMVADFSHEALLWGHPAVAAALVLGQGSECGQAAVARIDDLPFYVYQAGGEARALPCAEVLLTDRAAGAIRARGIMPLRSVRQRDAVQLLGFQSLADPPLGERGA